MMKFFNSLNYPISLVVASIIALSGVIISALVISVIAQKLLLTREEKYLYTFVQNSNFTKQYLDQAANVVKFAVKLWCLKARHKSHLVKYFLMQQKLHKSLQCIKQTKYQKRSLVDNCVHMRELMTMQRGTNVQMDNIVHQMVIMQAESKKIDEKLNNLQATLNTLLNSRTI